MTEFVRQEGSAPLLFEEGRTTSSPLPFEGQVPSQTPAPPHEEITRPLGTIERRER
jgi:hypothetical protein